MYNVVCKVQGSYEYFNLNVAKILYSKLLRAYANVFRGNANTCEKNMPLCAP